MSVTPGLGAFNKDKVANKFGIQLKPKGASQPSSTTKIIPPTESSNITKNKTVSDFRTKNSNNGFLSKTTEPPKKLPDKTLTSKSTSGLLSTSVNNERTDSLTSNVNHSTKKAKEPSSTKSPTTTKRSNITSNERSISPAPTVKRPSVPSTAATTTTTTTTATPTAKTVAQIEHQKDQPLYRRQLSKPLESTSSTASLTTTTTAGASTTALKR